MIVLIKIFNIISEFKLFTIGKYGDISSSSN